MTKDLTKKLGEAEFDLSKYANDEKAWEDKLPLKYCDIDSQGFIQIFIKAKVLD